MNTKSYLHNCNTGDLIAALAGIREVYRKSGKKAVIYQELDLPGHYMQGLVHSVRDDKGVQVTMNQKMFDMMRPLLLSQQYVEDFVVYDGQKIDIDLTIIRERVEVDAEHPEKPPKIIGAKQFVNIPHLALPGWTMTAFPPMACDISEPWIEVEDGDMVIEDFIIVNRTERYQLTKINYAFLKKYEKDLLFAGTETEHFKFCKEFGLNFPRLEVHHFLDLAQVLKKCRFFVGNQSFPWNLANALGIPRILEMFPQAPNCQPFVGKDNYGFLQQLPLEYYFEMLYNKQAAPLRQPE
jgi:hypothetical protein